MLSKGSGASMVLLGSGVFPEGRGKPFQAVSDLALGVISGRKQRSADDEWAREH